MPCLPVNRCYDVRLACMQNGHGTHNSIPPPFRFFIPCRGTWLTHGVAALLASTLRLHRSMPAWWRRAAALPFRLFTGLLRKRLGRCGASLCPCCLRMCGGTA